jgi:hypothetical protein
MKRIKIRIKMQPSTISRICHHGTLCERLFDCNPLLVAEEVVVVLVDVGGTCTKSERHAPKPGITFDPLQLADTHVPARKT